MNIERKYDFNFMTDMIGLNTETLNIVFIPGFNIGELIIKSENRLTGMISFYYIRLNESDYEMMRSDGKRFKDIILSEINNYNLIDDESDNNDKNEFINNTFISKITVTKNGEETIIKE